MGGYKRWKFVDYDTSRLKVFGGWVLNYREVCLFIFDPLHLWKLEREAE